MGARPKRSRYSINRFSLTALASASWCSPHSGEPRAPRARPRVEEFSVVEARLGANTRERRLLRRDIGLTSGATGPSRAAAGTGTSIPPTGTRTSAPPAGAGTGAGATPGRKEVSNITTPFADRIPEGPGFAISGAEKPKKSDSPLTTPILTITIDPTFSANLHPAVINAAIRLVLMQDLGAEGQALTIPGASEPSKDPDAARAPGGWTPRTMLEGLSAFLMPPQLRASLRGEYLPAPRASRPAVERQGSAANASPIKIILTSLGRSSGDAFQMTVLNEGPAPVKLTGDAFVLEPVAGVTQATIDGDLASSRGAGRATVTLKAYCLEFLKQPPTVGTVFRLAPEGVQRRFRNFGRIFEATRKLQDAGKLRPGAGDPSDPASYIDDIRQWAIWTQEQGFDEKGYARAFTEHSRKNVEAAGHKWTRELDNAFTGLAGGRWHAVQAVLREAAVGR